LADGGDLGSPRTAYDCLTFGKLSIAESPTAKGKKKRGGRAAQNIEIKYKTLKYNML